MAEIIGTEIISARPEKTVDKVVGIKCDLCDRTGKPAIDNEADWSDLHCEIEITSLSYESGCHYPEGGSTETEKFHVCPECWNSKLKPWMASQNAIPTLSQSEY